MPFFTDTSVHLVYQSNILMLQFVSLRFVHYLSQANRDVPTVDGEEALDIDHYTLPFLFSRSQSPQYSGGLEVREAEVVCGAGVGEQRPFRAANERHAVAGRVVLLDSKPVTSIC